MKTSYIVNVFGKVVNKTIDSRREMVIYKDRNRIRITIPVKAQKVTGFIRKDVLEKLQELSRENMLYLEKKYGMTFTYDPNGFMVA